MQLLGFSLFMWPRYKKIMLTNRWGSPNVSYCSAKFGSHRYCVNVDIMLFFICHVIMWSKAHLASYVGYSDGKLPVCQVWWAQVLWKCRYKFFSFATWPRNQKVTWLLRVVPTTSYHSAMFCGHRYCRSARIRCYIWHVTTWSKGHLTEYVGSSNGKLPHYHVWWP